MDQLEVIKSLLRSDKVKDKKESLRLLELALASPAVLQLLDAKTAHTWPSDKLAVVSWPGLLDVYISFVSRELLEGGGRKRGAPDVTLSRTLRHLVVAADNEQRSGRKHLLLRRAGKLFEHIAAAVSVPGLLAGPIGSDYLTILRNHLLVPGNEYAPTAVNATFQELLDAFMGRMEDLQRAHPESLPAGAGAGGADANGVLHVISSLLSLFPGDMSGAFRGDMIAWFEELLKYLHAVRDCGRFSLAAMAALNAFLLNNALDVLERVSALHAAIAPYVRWAWRDTRLPKLKEAFVCYSLIVLQLDVVQPLHLPESSSKDAVGSDGSGGGGAASRVDGSSSGVGGAAGGAPLESLYELVCRDIDADAVKLDTSPLAALQLLQLAAGLVHHMADRAKLEGYSTVFLNQGAASEDAYQRPNKRRRSELPPLPRLLAQASVAPARWGPVLALLLRLHPHGLCPSSCQAVLHMLASALGVEPDSVPHRPQHSLEHGSLASRVWLVRCVAELAQVWGLCIAVAAAGSANSHSLPAGHLMSTPSAVHVATWQALLQLLLAYAAPPQPAKPAHGAALQPTQYDARLLSSGGSSSSSMSSEAAALQQEALAAAAAIVRADLAWSGPQLSAAALLALPPPLAAPAASELVAAAFKSASDRGVGAMQDVEARSQLLMQLLAAPAAAAATPRCLAFAVLSVIDLHTQDTVSGTRYTCSIAASILGHPSTVPAPSTAGSGGSKSTGFSCPASGSSGAAAAAGFPTSLGAGWPWSAAENAGSGCSSHGVMEVVDAELLHDLFPAALPAWCSCSTEIARWLVQLWGLTHGREYQQRRMWLQLQGALVTSAGGIACDTSAATATGGAAEFSGELVSAAEVVSPAGSLQSPLQTQLVSVLGQTLSHRLNGVTCGESPGDESELVPMLVLCHIAAAMLPSVATTMTASVPATATASTTASNKSSFVANNSPGDAVRLADLVCKCALAAAKALLGGCSGSSMQLVLQPRLASILLPLLLSLLGELAVLHTVQCPPLHTALQAGLGPLVVSVAECQQALLAAADAHASRAEAAAGGGFGETDTSGFSSTGPGYGGRPKPAAATLDDDLDFGAPVAQMTRRPAARPTPTTASAVAAATAGMPGVLGGGPMPAAAVGTVGGLIVGAGPPQVVQTEVPITQQQLCLRLFKALARPAVSATAASIVRIWQSLHVQPTAPTTELLEGLATALCTAVETGASGSCSNSSGVTAATEPTDAVVRSTEGGYFATALDMLGTERGLLSGKLLPISRLAFVLVQLRVLMRLLARQAGREAAAVTPRRRHAHAQAIPQSLLQQSEKPGEDEDMPQQELAPESALVTLDAVLAAVEAVMVLMTDARTRHATQDPVPWQARTALIAIAADAISLDAPRLHGSPILDVLTNGLHDIDAFRARRMSAMRMPILFESWAVHPRILDIVVDSARLACRPASATQAQVLPPSVEFAEPSILALGQVAAVAAVRSEARCVLLLLAHAAECPRDVQLVNDTLQLLAARMQYAGTAQYLRYHVPVLAWQWFEEGYTLQQLMPLHRLFTSTTFEPMQQPVQLPPTARVVGTVVGPEAGALGTAAVTDSNGGAAAEEGGSGIVSSSRIAFLQEHAGALLVPLLLQADADAIGEVAAELQLSVPDLLSSRFADVFSAFMPYSQTEHQAVAHRVLQGPILSAAIPDADALLVKHMTQVLGRLLSLADPGDKVEETVPLFSCEAIVVSVQAIPGRTPQQNAQILWTSLLTGPVISSMLQHVHQHIQAAAHTRHRRQRLASLHATLILLGPHAAEPSACRYILHILLQQLQLPELQSTACELITTLLRHLLQPQPCDPPSGLTPADNLATLSHLLPSLVSGLVEALEGRQPNAGSPVVAAAPVFATASVGTAAPALLDVGAGVEDPLLQLLLQVTVGAPPQLQPCLARSVPLPELPALHEARQLQQRAKQEVLLPEELHNFARSARRMGSASRQRALLALMEALDSRWNELLTDPADAASPLQPAVMACGWHLVSTAAELSDPGLSRLVGRLLAAAGPLDPNAIAADVPSLDAGSSSPFGNALHASILAAAAPSAPAGHKRKSATAAAAAASADKAILPVDLVCACLRLIHTYLLDSDIEVIAQAQRTATALLARPEGATALAALATAAATVTSGPALDGPAGAFGGGLGRMQHAADAAAVARNLRAYVSDPATVIVSVTSLQQPPPQANLYEARYWQPPAAAVAGAGPVAMAAATAAYERWLCRLTSALMTHAHDPLLQLMHNLAQLKPELCELLLPPLLHDLVTAGASADPLLPAILTRQLSDHVLAGNGVDPKALQLVLRGLDHLRNLRREAAAATLPIRKAKDTAIRPVPLTWSKEYCLDLDYLLVATAAVRCAAYFSALMYAELWAEERQGCTLGALQTLAAEAEVAGVGALLMDVYTRINEPDSIYALSGRPDATAQLQLSEHEGDWVAALSGYDLLLRPHALLPPSQVLLMPARPPQATAAFKGVGGKATKAVTPAAATAIAGGRLSIAEVAGPSPASVAGAASPASIMEAASAQRQRGCTGLVAALRALGCQHAAQLYLTGYSRSAYASSIIPDMRRAESCAIESSLATGASESLSPELAEQQFELAWRLGTWSSEPSAQPLERSPSSLPTQVAALDPAAAAKFKSTRTSSGGSRTDFLDIVSAGGGGGAGCWASARNTVPTGFQHAVLLCMQALAAGASRANVEALLVSATQGVVQRLASTSTESVGSVNPALLHLQMLAMLQEATSLSCSNSSSGSRHTSNSGSGHHSLTSSTRQFQATLGSIAIGSATGYASTYPMLLGSIQLNSIHREASPTIGVAAGGNGQSTWVHEMQSNRNGLVGGSGDYGLDEPLLALRCAVLGVLRRPELQVDALMASAVAARRAGKAVAGMAALQELAAVLQANAQVDRPASSRCTSSSSGDANWANQLLGLDSPWRLEEARLMWRQGRRQLALQTVTALVETLGAQVEAAAAAAGSGTAAAGGVAGKLQLAAARSLAGKWAAAAQLDSNTATTVLNQFSQAAALVTAMEPISTTAAASAAGNKAAASPDVATKVLYRLASYADKRYKALLTQKRSPEFITQQRVIKKKREDLAHLHSQLQQPGLEARPKQYLKNQIAKMTKPLESDESMQNTLLQSEGRFLVLALRNYGRCLKAGDKHDRHAVFRFVQLWLTLGESVSADVTAIFRAVFKEVPSYKFVPLVYQIASRLSGPLGKGDGSDGGGERAFQEVLQALLLRLALDHPFHTLYQLCALRNAGLGASGRVEAKDSSLHGVFAHTMDHGRIAGAEALLTRVGRNSQRHATILKQICTLVGGYIEVAAMPAPADEGGHTPPMTFPASVRRKAANLDHIPVVSVQLPPDPTACYDNMPTFVKFGDIISFVGGVNKPKLVRAHDSSGREHKQLVKSGNDDLRQDAVMQQFFGLVSQFLGQDADAARRRLRINTYKIVPFSPFAGLVEWVEDTLAMSEYLLGPDRVSGAHGRYRRQGDHDFWKAMTILREAPAGELRKAFDTACAGFTPVMHRFFSETYRDPSLWFERRTNYTRSTAVNSMAGYVIGLGDRHGGNILLSRSTAEVVHIDLGIAFEQGRFLNTAELVPFRLTRDIVDGMGINGVEGVMRRCCEITMQVLREHSEALLMVIEVMIHDPQIRWALTPIMALKRQQEEVDLTGTQDLARMAGTIPNHGDAGELGNADAERAVLRVKQKLEGVEGGEGQPRTVAGQVALLLQEAQDPDLLCRMYVGWAAWV